MGQILVVRKKQNKLHAWDQILLINLCDIYMTIVWLSLHIHIYTYTYMYINFNVVLFIYVCVCVGSLPSDAMASETLDQINGLSSHYLNQ